MRLIIKDVKIVYGEITVCLVIVKKINSNLIAAIPKLYSMID